MFSVEVEIVLYLGIFLNFPTVFLKLHKNNDRAKKFGETIILLIL